MENLSDRLKVARKEAGLSQAALAKKAHLKNQSIIASLESGYRKSSSHIPSIAEALGVEPLWLSKGRGPKRKFSVLTTKREEEILYLNESLRELDEEDFEKVKSVSQDLANYLREKKTKADKK